MEPLVLLCNLYADGPQTLRRLHASGVRTLAELELVPVDRLTDVLGSTPTSARRLQREARLWRIGAGARCLSDGDAPVAAHVAISSHASSHAATTDEPTRTFAAHAAASRTLAARDPAASLARSAPRVHALPLDEIAPTGGLPSTKIAPVRRPAPETASTTLLRGGLIADLDLAACQRLVGEGIRTLAQLACAPAARLAPLIGSPTAQVEAWRARAQELLAGGASAREPLEARPAAHVPELGDPLLDGGERFADQGAADASFSGERTRSERVVELRPAPRGRPPTPVWSAEIARRSDKSVVRGLHSTLRNDVDPYEASGPFA